MLTALKGSKDRVTALQTASAPDIFFSSCRSWGWGGWYEEKTFSGVGYGELFVPTVQDTYAMQTSATVTNQVESK